MKMLRDSRGYTFVEVLVVVTILLILASAVMPLAQVTSQRMRETELRRTLTATVLISMSWDLQTFVVPVHGTRVGLSASEIGFVLGAFAVATFTIRLAMPWLSRRFSEWQVLTYTLFNTTVAFLLFPFFSSLAPLMAVAFLLGLGLGAAQPNVMSLLHARSPAGRVGEAALVL